MTITLSPQMRIVAALGGLAALGLAAFMLTLGRSSPAAATQSGLTPAEQSALHGKPKAKTHAKPKAAPAAPKRTVSPKLKPKPAPAITLLPGLPPDLAHALRAREVVVVSIYDPQARVDTTARAEASAAAALTHTGFVPLNVLDQRQAGPLMRQLGVLPDPAVLVYKRPGKLVARFDGFADRDTIAQAVTNVLPPELARQIKRPVTRAPVSLATWADGANKACTSFTSKATKLKRNIPAVIALEEMLARKLAALPLPTASSNRILAKRLVTGVAQLHAAEQRLYLAVKRGNQAGIKQAIVDQTAVATRESAAAADAGAPHCAVFG